MRNTPRRETGNGRFSAIAMALAALITALTGLLAVGPKLGWWGIPDSQVTDASRDKANSSQEAREKSDKGGTEASRLEHSGSSFAKSEPPTKLTSSYDAVYVLKEDGVAIDPTGLSFTVETVWDFWLLRRHRGVTIRYQLPDGDTDYGTRQAGFRRDFESQGRRFMLIIESIDYEEKTAKIRIREL